MHDDEWYRRKYGTFDGGKGFNSTERVKKFGEVFTPRWIVEKMLDEVPDVGNVEKTVFEPCCGEGAFITCVLRRKLASARTEAERVRACQTCYGLDIQLDNVEICRARMTAIAASHGVELDTAARIFCTNIIHGDMLFFPMIARFYDWKTGTWESLEQMGVRAG